MLDARPNQGWKAEVEERSADEIEVAFLREDEEWRFDAEVDDGRPAVETGQKLRDAEGGTYRLGDVGAVEIRQQGDGISLVHTRTTGDWEPTSSGGMAMRSTPPAKRRSPSGSSPVRAQEEAT